LQAEVCTWVGIPTVGGIILPLGNKYFPSDTIPEDITEYFLILENTLDTNIFLVILLRDINARGFNWKKG
jgi:hypothetical protein